MLEAVVNLLEAALLLAVATLLILLTRTTLRDHQLLPVQLLEAIPPITALATSMSR